MDWQTLRKNIKEGNFARLYLFYGEEWYLREHSVTTLKDAILTEGMEEFNFHLFTGEFAFEDLQEAVDSYPVMQEKKLILVQDFDPFKANEATREKYTKLIDDLPETCVLVFAFGGKWKPDTRVKLYKLFSKVGEVVEFARAKQSELITWVKRRFQSAGRTIDNDLCEYIIFQCGNLMGGLIPEIEKVAAFAKNEVITKTDIDAVISPCLETVVFDLTRMIVSKNYAKAIEMTEALDAMKESPIMVGALIAKQMRQLYAAGLVLERRGTARDLMDVLKLNSDYIAKGILQSACGASIAWLRNSLILCEELDQKLKFGEGFNVIREFIARLAESGARL